MTRGREREKSIEGRDVEWLVKNFETTWWLDESSGDEDRRTIEQASHRIVMQEWRAMEAARVALGRLNEASCQGISEVVLREMEIVGTEIQRARDLGEQAERLGIQEWQKAWLDLKQPKRPNRVGQARVTSSFGRGMDCSPRRGEAGVTDLAPGLRGPP